MTEKNDLACRYLSPEAADGLVSLYKNNASSGDMDAYRAKTGCKSSPKWFVLSHTGSPFELFCTDHVVQGFLSKGMVRVYSIEDIEVKDYLSWKRSLSFDVRRDCQRQLDRIILKLTEQAEQIADSAERDIASLFNQMKMNEQDAADQIASRVHREVFGSVDD